MHTHFRKGWRVVKTDMSTCLLKTPQCRLEQRSDPAFCGLNQCIAMQMHAWKIQAARIQAVRIQTARIQAARIETIWGWKQDVGGEFRRRDAQCRFLRRWHNWSGRLQSQSSTSSTSALPLAASASAWTSVTKSCYINWLHRFHHSNCNIMIVRKLREDKQVSRLNFLWGLWVLSHSEEEWEPENMNIYPK